MTNPRDVLDSTVARIGEVISDAVPILTALDEASGDGDFGGNFDEGLTRVGSVVADGNEPWGALQAVFLDEVGGTSGPLFGLLFQALGQAAEESSSYDTALSAGLGHGLAAIQRVGEAEVGDRTLVDALAPAARALATEPGDVAAAVVVGIDGARETATFRARRGRSSYVGDRALGHPDPGAVGLALLLTVLAEPVVGEQPMAAERSRLLS